MKINGYGSVSSASSIKKRGVTSSASSASVSEFAELLAAAEAADAAPPTHISDISATTALNNLLSLQEISAEDIQRRKLVQQGKTLLDTLEELRQRLLIGSLPPHLLQNLGRQLSIQKQMVNDPKLNALIDDIELRAAVELAKLQKALADSRSLPL